MALIPCRECGKDVSTLASACPNCGAPVSSRQSNKAAEKPRGFAGTLGTVAGVIFVSLLVLIGAMSLTDQWFGAPRHQFEIAADPKKVEITGGEEKEGAPPPPSPATLPEHQRPQLEKAA